MTMVSGIDFSLSLFVMTEYEYYIFYIFPIIFWLWFSWYYVIFLTNDISSHCTVVSRPTRHQCRARSVISWYIFIEKNVLVTGWFAVLSTYTVHTKQYFIFQHNTPASKSNTEFSWHTIASNDSVKIYKTNLRRWPQTLAQSPLMETMDLVLMTPRDLPHLSRVLSVKKRLIEAHVLRLGRHWHCLQMLRTACGLD